MPRLAFEFLIHGFPRDLRTVEGGSLHLYINTLIVVDQNKAFYSLFALWKIRIGIKISCFVKKPLVSYTYCTVVVNVRENNGYRFWSCYSSLNPQSSVDFVPRSEHPLAPLSLFQRPSLARRRVNCRKTRWKSKVPPRTLSLSLPFSPFLLLTTTLFSARARRSFADRNTEDEDTLFLSTTPLLPSQTYLIENRHPSVSFLSARRVQRRRAFLFFFCRLRPARCNLSQAARFHCPEIGSAMREPRRASSRAPTSIASSNFMRYYTCFRLSTIKGDECAKLPERMARKLFGAERQSQLLILSRPIRDIFA